MNDKTAEKSSSWKRLLLYNFVVSFCSEPSFTG